MPVVDGDLVAHAAQMIRRAEARGARADDPDRLRQLARRLQRSDPTFFPGLVVDVLLHRADGDGAVAGLLDDAVALAKAVLRADAAADFRHGAGGLRQLIGLADAPFGGHPQPVGDVVVQRAMGLAERNAALRAARGLFPGLGVDEVGVDLVEVLRTGVHVALGGHAALDRHEFEHALSHRPLGPFHAWFREQAGHTPAARRRKHERPSSGLQNPPPGDRRQILALMSGAIVYFMDEPRIYHARGTQGGQEELACMIG